MVEVDYKVDYKEEIRQLTKAGEVETWYRVWATTKKGTYFHIDVPEKDMGTEKESAAVSKKAKALDAI